MLGVRKEEEEEEEEEVVDLFLCRPLKIGGVRYVIF